MTEPWPVGTEFIEEWLAGKSDDDDLDHEVVALIERHRDGETLDEDGLFDALIALAEEGQQDNGSN
jgi:hypothetical protein